MAQSPGKWRRYAKRACLEFGLPGVIAVGWGSFCRWRGLSFVESASSAFLAFAVSNATFGQLLRIAKNRKDDDSQKETRIRLEAIERKIDALNELSALLKDDKKATNHPRPGRNLFAASRAIKQTNRYFAHAEMAINNGQYFPAVTSAVLAFERGLREAAQGFQLDSKASLRGVVDQLGQEFKNEIFQKRLNDLMSKRDGLAEAGGSRQSFSRAEASELVAAFRSGIDFLSREIGRVLPKPPERPEREPWVAGY